MLFKPEGSETIDPAYKDEDGAFTAVSVNTIVYAYNTTLVPPPRCRSPRSIFSNRGSRASSSPPIRPRTTPAFRCST
jgi:hypothetical protein